MVLPDLRINLKNINAEKNARPKPKVRKYTKRKLSAPLVKYIKALLEDLKEVNM